MKLNREAILEIHPDVTEYVGGLRLIYIISSKIMKLLIDKTVLTAKIIELEFFCF